MTPEALRSTDQAAANPREGKTVALNGVHRRIAAGTTVSALLRDLDLPEDRVAVELDGKILKRPTWSETEPADGARIEVVHFVGGG
jgi:thiamine biosynthesis protein ThiS